MTNEEKDTLRFVCGPEYKYIIDVFIKELELFGRTSEFEIDPEMHCISRNNLIHSSSLGWTIDEIRENKIKVYRIGPEVYILEFPKPHRIDPIPSGGGDIY